MLALFCTAAKAAPDSHIGPDPEGAVLCAENGEGTHTTRYPNGVLKIRVVCRDTIGDAQVRYGWYFDDKGRQTREEDLVPDKLEMSRITVHEYELSADEATATRIYNGKGKLLQALGGEKVKKKIEGASTFTEYLSLCEASPNELLYPLMGAEKEAQFFTKNACACVAKKAIQADELPPSGVWKRTKTLNHDNPMHRASVAGLGNLQECLCPEAFPDSRLEKLCQHAGDIEKAWKP